MITDYNCFVSLIECHCLIGKMLQRGALKLSAL